MFGDGGTVCGGTIALVMSPFVGGVTWVALREVDHQPVSGHFGDDRRGGDGGAMLVAFDLVVMSAGIGTSRRVERVERLGDVIARPVENSGDFGQSTNASPAISNGFPLRSLPDDLPQSPPQTPPKPFFIVDSPPSRKPSSRSTWLSARRAATPSA